MLTDPTSGEITCKSCKDKSIDRHLTLWTHQNNLLWGRLQTVSGLQLAVFAGWYATFVKGDGFVCDLIGAMVALLGLWLSCQLKKLITKDIGFRNSQRDKIRRLEKLIEQEYQLFPIPTPPDRDGKGAEVMLNTVSCFICLIGITIVLSVGKLMICLFHWIACGCSCLG